MRHDRGGPGDPAQSRLYLFLATGDQQNADLASQLKALNGYQLAAGAAGLPSLAAVGAGSLEPSRVGDHGLPRRPEITVVV